MASAEYSGLKARILHLTKTLPALGSPTSSLTITEIDQIKAFAVHVSAACEHFMEQRCEFAADSAYNDFMGQQLLGRVGKHLCVFPFIEMPKDGGEIRKVVALYGSPGFGIRLNKVMINNNKRQIEDVLKIGYKKYKTTLRNNHGIAEKYQLKMMSALGLDITSFNPTFRSRITQLSDFRGEAAHKYVVAAATLPQPSDLLILATDLITGFYDVDKAISKLVKLRN